MPNTIPTNTFVQSASGRAVIDDATRLARPWVANRAVSNGIRALAHEKFRADPSAKQIELGAEDARTLYALVENAAAEADQDPKYKGALTSEGLPVGADALGGFSGGARYGSAWLKATTYDQAMQLNFEDAPESSYVQVELSAAFRSELHRLLSSDAEGAILENADLQAAAKLAEERAESTFLRGGRQLRHGGYFPLPARDKATLSPVELARLAQNKDAARIAIAFGFGQVFGQASKGCGCGPL